MLLPLQFWYNSLFMRKLIAIYTVAVFFCSPFVPLAESFVHSFADSSSEEAEGGLHSGHYCAVSHGPCKHGTACPSRHGMGHGIVDEIGHEAGHDDGGVHGGHEESARTSTHGDASHKEVVRDAPTASDRSVTVISTCHPSGDAKSHSVAVMFEPALNESHHVGGLSLTEGAVYIAHPSYTDPYISTSHRPPAYL